MGEANEGVAKRLPLERGRPLPQKDQRGGGRGRQYAVDHGVERQPGRNQHGVRHPSRRERHVRQCHRELPGRQPHHTTSTEEGLTNVSVTLAGNFKGRMAKRRPDTGGGRLVHSNVQQAGEGRASGEPSLIANRR